jgi:hypothetical protein
MEAGLQLLAQRRLGSFAPQVVRDPSDPDYDYSRRRWWYHVKICEALDDLVRFVEFKGKRGGISRLSISMPPQHGKSLHGAELLPAFAFGRNADKRIMLGTYSSEFAKRAITNARKIIDSPEYKALFSTRIGSLRQVALEDHREQTISAKDTASYFETLKLRDPEDPKSGYVHARGSYIAQGMNGQITGRGFDYGIIDDLIKNAVEAMSPLHFEKMKAFYLSCFNTRGSPFAVQLYTATRWTSPDFADWLAEFWRNSGRTVTELKFAAIAEQIDLDNGDPRQLGETLDNPDYRLPEHYYDLRKGLLVEAPWMWDGQQQQRPTSGGSRLFPPDAWQRYNETFTLDDMARIFTGGIHMSIDAAMVETGASFTVIHVIGLVHRGDCENWFLLEEARGHWDDTKFIAEFQRVHAKWMAVFPQRMSEGKIWVENKALGPVLMSRLAAGDYNFEPVAKAANKTACQRLAADEIRAKRYWLPDGKWGTDPTDPSEHLIDDTFVGSFSDKGSFIYEHASTTKPDDRRDTTAQIVLCTSRYKGRELLGIRA